MRSSVSEEQMDVGHGNWDLTNLLELLNGTLVNTTALVDQVTGSGRLCEEGMLALGHDTGDIGVRLLGERNLRTSRVDVSDDDDVDVGLVFLAHFEGFERFENGSVKLVGDLRDGRGMVRR